MMKESIEVLDFFDAVSKAVKETLADGRVTLFDLKNTPGLVGPAQKAIKDANKIPEEFKNATSEDLQMIAQKSFDVAFALITAIFSAK